jgi:hypothetical protein
MASNSSKTSVLSATDSAPRPGDFPVGSASSRAAARMLLKHREREEDRNANRPPDVRMVFDLPRHRVEVEPVSSDRVRSNRVDRHIDRGKIVEIVFPAHAYKGECLGVCSVSPDVSVEEALRELRKRREG